MSNSKFEYVKTYETDKQLLKNTYILIRIDGKAFTSLCESHKLIKPNDIRCIRLMISSAFNVISTFPDIFLSYGQSDEFSFAFRKESNVYNRREEKILSLVVSAFTSAFVYNWKLFFDEDLKFPPSFDGRVVLYPDNKTLSDYFSWRQVDCHINNLYNTVFWSLVEKGLSTTEAHLKLKGTFSKDKHEILFSNGINYNNIENVFKRGTLIIKNLEVEKRNQKGKSEILLEKTFVGLRIDNEEDCFQKAEKVLFDEKRNFYKEYNKINSKGFFISHEDIISKEDFWKGLLD